MIKMKAWAFSAMVGFGVCIGFSASWADAPPIAPQALSLNSYDNLPAPDAAEEAELFAKVHLTEKGRAALTPDWRVRLGKILKVLKRLSVPVPNDWRGGAPSVFPNMLQYVSDVTTTLNLDLSQSGSTAYNSRGKVYLGARFFVNDPLDSLVTIIHEARHTSENDPGHTRCRSGDAALSEGACDEAFRTDEYAGAYAFDTSLRYGLAKFGPDLSPADREYFRSGALARLGSRFNVVPAELSTPHDFIAVLDSAGKVWLVHPFTNDLIPAPIQFEGKTIERIEYYSSNNGLTIYTNDQKAFGWRIGYLPVQLFTDSAGADAKVTYATLLNDGRDTEVHFIDNAHAIQVIEMDPATGKRVAQKVKWDMRDIQATKLTMGPKFARYILDARGDVYQVSSTLFGNNSLKPAENFKRPDGWSFAGTGVFYDTLYGLSRSGKFHYLDAATTTATASTFQINKMAIKFAEGASIRALLDDTGALHVTRYSSNTVTQIKPRVPGGAKVIDFAIGRSQYASDKLTPGKEPSASFVRRCAVTKGSVDPWLGQGIGVDDRGLLVFEGTAARPCLRLDARAPELAQLPADLTEYAIGSTKSENGKFSRTSLKLRGRDSKELTIHPYSISNDH